MPHTKCATFPKNRREKIIFDVDFTKVCTKVSNYEDKFPAKDQQSEAESTISLKQQTNTCIYNVEIKI